MTQPKGRFIGKLAPSWLEDGRHMKLDNNFTFKDGENFQWTAPKGTIVDGASIPRILWTFIGGPFEGKYRRASVVHDYYCQVKDQPWFRVHRMFYEACLVEGLNEIQAKVMYAGVYAGGPRWIVDIVPEYRSNREQQQQQQAPPPYEYNYQLPQDFINIIQPWMTMTNPSLDEIDKNVDTKFAEPGNLRR